jgi:peptidoglycan/LPS O-acetylase OafA/YrhL
MACTLSRPRRDLATIQALRAAAALLVVLKHTPLDIGNFGVDIFFVISGFIISFVASRDTSNFLARRLFRVVPLYWLGTLVVASVMLLAPNLLRHPMRDAGDLLCSLLFVPYRSPNGFVEPVLFLGWTLNYEMFFYALFALALWVSRKNHAVLVLAGLVSLVLIGWALPLRAIPLQFWTSPIMLEFGFGVVLFQLWRRQWIPTVRPGAAIALVAAPMLLLCIAERQGFAGERFLWSGIPAFLVVVVALAAEGRVAVPAFLVLIGDASYSLYLFHPYLVIGINRLLAFAVDNVLLQYLAIVPTVMLAVALAVMCYRYVEKPSNTWLRHRFLKPTGFVDAVGPGAGRVRSAAN